MPMSEASARVLVDRSVVRLDGRPLFSFGPRVLLTAPEKYPQVLEEIARAGFTIVGSPPCSPGNIPQIEAFFDAADKAGVMVVLIADPRLPYHGVYMAQRFRHRPSLHSYLITPRPSTRDGLDAYQRERDSLRARDLFHPIFHPLSTDHLAKAWLLSQDFFSPLCGRPRVGSRIHNQQLGASVRRLAGALGGVTPRPIFVTGLDAVTSDEERAAGLFSDDPWVARFSSRALDWFPFLANFGELPRTDLLGPQPELLRLQVYDAIAAGVRGVMLDFYEGMTGPLPFTGRDRFCEAATIANEIAVFNDFFAEGQLADIELETGHPRLGASVIRHGMEHLVLLRIEGYEEEYFVDEAYMERTEIGLRWKGEGELTAWRMDFPEPRELRIVRDSVGSIRIPAGPLEMTGVVLLTPGNKRVRELSRTLAIRLPRVAWYQIEARRAGFLKIHHIEERLRMIGVGIDNRERMNLAERIIYEAEEHYKRQEFAEAYRKSKHAGRVLRTVIKYQMARALATPIYNNKNRHLSILRTNYFSLPTFYRAGAKELLRAFTELT